MWPFNNNDQTDEAKPVVPEEVKDYYQAEKRERIGVAWLLALATFFAVTIVVIGMFMGGRALYRHFQNDDANTAQTDSSDEQTDDTSDSSNDNSTGSTGTTTPSQTPTQTANPSQPSTTAPTTTLQRTGPEGDD
jgi:cytoskeletal protein RodZ